MQLHPGHSQGSRTVHLTHTTLVVEGLCGESVGFHGEPDLAVVCVDCLEVAASFGIDVSFRSDESRVVVHLPVAA
jgi:hypothetical protein